MTLSDRAKVLTRKAKNKVMGVGGAQLANLLSALARTSDKNVLRLIGLFEKLAASEHHRGQLRQLAELVQQDHPAIELIRRLMRLHPNYSRRVIQNLGINATWLGEEKRRDFALRTGVYPPYLIVISPTMRCNLKCLGCYAGQYPKEPDALSLGMLDRIVSEAKEMGTYFFTISGGEPFVRHDLLDLYEKHSDCTFLIYTNGTRIDDQAIERMQKSGNVAPALSLEGFEQDTDFRRGKGVYAQVMDAMDRLRDAGIMFGYSATATRLNAEVFLREEFYDQMIDVGLMVTPEQRDQLRAMSLQVRRTKPIFAADFWNDGCLTSGCMSGGRLYLHINYRGDIEPCVFIHFATHNILEMYEKGRHLWEVLESPFFCAVRDCNRRDPNRLRPCIIIDHNEWLVDAVRKSGAKPTHPGAEDIVTVLAREVQQWGRDYAPFANRAWDSGEYDWAKQPSGPVRGEVLVGPSAGEQT
jgi:MoaA/NifB/PqqE/SkfB family radical SAM enzyme